MVGKARQWDRFPGFGPASLAEGIRAERILLADDNADMREYVTRLLSERYRVVAVANGEEALEAALSDPPDLILSDVMMPRLDGFGLLEKLRGEEATRTIPVVLLSARAGEESRVEGLGAGADDYLVKPFTARELLARVAAHLSMRRRRKEAEEALRESQATLQSFYDSSSFLMGVVVLEGEDIVPIYCNLGDRNVLLRHGRRDRIRPPDQAGAWNPARNRRPLGSVLSPKPDRKSGRGIRI